MTRLKIYLVFLEILVVFLPIFVNSETIRLEREISKTTIIPSTDNKILVENDNLENTAKGSYTNDTSGSSFKIKKKESISIPVNEISTAAANEKDIRRLQNVESTTQTIKLSPIPAPPSYRRNLTKLLPLKVDSFNNTVDNALDKSESLNEDKLMLPMNNNSRNKHDNLNSFNDITENITSPGNDDPINLEKTKLNFEVEKSVNNTNGNSDNQVLTNITTRKYKLVDTDGLEKTENATNTLNYVSLNTTLNIFDTKSSEAPLLSNLSENGYKLSEKIGVNNKSEINLTTEENSSRDNGVTEDSVKSDPDVINTNKMERPDFRTKTKNEKLLNYSSEVMYKQTTEDTTVTQNYSEPSDFTSTVRSDVKLTSTSEYTTSPESSTVNLPSISVTKYSVESTTSSAEASVTSDSTIDTDAEPDVFISTLSFGLNDDIFQSTQSSSLATQDAKTEGPDIVKTSTTTESDFDSTLPEILKNNSIQFTTVTHKLATTTTAHTIELPDQTSEPIIEKYNIPKQENEPTTYIPEHSTNEIIDREQEPISDNETDYVWIAIGASAVGIIALILLVFISCYYMKKRSKLTYGQRCRPVSLDAYSLDNISIHNSVRRREKNGIRASKKSFGNIAFDDPSLKHNPMGIHDLAKFIEKKATIYEEFRGIPQITARADEVPQGCEDKNRYANVVPLPETRVFLQRQNEDETTEYINANYVRGPKDSPNYYIACQAPIENTITDFWRMVWEQNCYVIIMATDIIENGIEKCAEYLPQSNFANSLVFDNFHITLKNREVKQKYAITTMNLKNSLTNTTREITHFWYKWPETGVPADESSIIAMLLEARSCLKMPPNEFSEVNGGNDTNPTNDTNENTSEINNKMEKSKTKIQGPLVIHCSPGTSRTGTIIACDIAIRSLEQTRRTIDIPQFVYYIRRGRAAAIQTKEQYEFIYRVSNLYATKISGPVNDN